MRGNSRVTGSQPYSLRTASSLAVVRVIADDADVNDSSFCLGVATVTPLSVATFFLLPFCTPTILSTAYRTAFCAALHRPPPTATAVARHSTDHRLPQAPTAIYRLSAACDSVLQQHVTRQIKLTGKP